MLTPISPSPSLAHEIENLRNHWGWFLALGIAMVVFGTIAIGQAVVATAAATVLFGFLLLAGGISLIVSAFWAGKWSGTLLHLLVGVLYVIVGLVFIAGILGTAHHYYWIGVGRGPLREPDVHRLRS